MLRYYFSKNCFAVVFLLLFFVTFADTAAAATSKSSVVWQPVLSYSQHQQAATRPSMLQFFLRVLLPHQLLQERVVVAALARVHLDMLIV